MSFDQPTFLRPVKPRTGTPLGVKWISAILGAAATIAGFAVFGTVIANVTTQYLVHHGVPLDQVKSYLADHWLSVPGILGISANLFSGVFGGWVSARDVASSRWLQGFVTSLVVTAFIAATYMSPGSYPGTFWQVVFTFIVPPLSIMVGAFLHARRT